MTFYLNSAEGEGLGTLWAFSGIPTEDAREICSLCCLRSCEKPEIHKIYEDEFGI